MAKTLEEIKEYVEQFTEDYLISKGNGIYDSSNQVDMSHVVIAIDQAYEAGLSARSDIKAAEAMMEDIATIDWNLVARQLACDMAYEYGDCSLTCNPYDRDDFCSECSRRLVQAVEEVQKRSEFSVYWNEIENPREFIEEHSWSPINHENSLSLNYKVVRLEYVRRIVEQYEADQAAKDIEIEHLRNGWATLICARGRWYNCRHTCKEGDFCSEIRDLINGKK